MTLLLLVLGVWPLGDLAAQPIPVGDVREGQFRTLQLLSDSAIATSLNNRPLWIETYDEAFNRLRNPSDSWWAQPVTPPRTEFLNFFTVGAYEPVFTYTLNSRLPYSENNGAAWYGRGHNTELQGGGYLTSDYLTITFRPHLIFTQNRNFETPRFIPSDSDGNPRYRAIFANIDMPFRFGPDAYTTFDWGQSSVRLHYKSIEAGFSNETLWWGPGVRYALMMSNHAAGVKHLFIGTRRPLKLPAIGDMEFRWIWGRPEDSEYFTENDNERFMNALNIVYSPSFIPNFSVGLARVFHKYIPEGGLQAADYFEILQAFQKTQQNFTDERGFNDVSNQLVSVYFRWVFPESGAEFYGEYFREDHNFDMRDFLMEPDHDRAYTLGLQKIIESNWIDFFKFNAEINSLVPNRVDEVRPQTYYYRHSRIKQGHTSKGEVLGAGIGPGSGSQYLGIEGYFESGMAGFFVQRVEDNDFFHFEYYDVPRLGTGYKDIWRHRINLNIGITGNYRTGPLLIGGKLIWNKNFNYGRRGYGDLDVTFDSVDKNDIVNLQLQVSARYFF